MRPDVSNVTEDDVKAMFNDDGELTEPSVDEESTEEPETEEQEETQDEETEEVEASSEDEIDWDKVDKRYKEHFEKVKADAEKWQRDHSKLQSKFTKTSQSQKEELKALEDYRRKANELSQWETLLERNPKLAQVVSQEIERINNPYQAEEVPDYLKNDPMFQHIQKSVAPTINALQQKIQYLEQKTQKLDQWESQQIEAKNRQYLDSQLDAAKEQVKSIFGSDATEEQVTAVLEYMVENKFYSNGKAAALAVFGDQYEKAARSRYENEMKEKAKKFPARTKTVNSNRVGSSRDATTPEEAIAMALAEQGM